MGLLMFFAALVATSNAYRHFQDEIPNGDKVPHPCKPNFIWRGVGHRNVLGGGKFNPFGEDFKLVKKWTRELCRKDSDGDGRTNGQELGDPDCIWSPGQFPTRVTNITHPGVCDPWGDAKCKTKNIWVSCDAGEFKCDAIKDPAVKNVTLRYPPTKVPPTETNYMCMTFDLPQDDDYHIIATMPFINNSNVMHHIVLYGCKDNVKTTTEPNLCYMSQEGCGEVIGIWTLGMTGDCLYKDAGFHIGKTGTKKAALQFHWTNPELTEDYVDSSGFTIFYTPKRRKYDAGFFMTGAMWLEIPPGQPRVTQSSLCPAECTNEILKGPIHVTSALNHMHYLGFEQNVELFRGDTKITDLAYDPVYSYDTPVVHRYDEPVEIRPGDHLKTTCVFRSLSKKQTTYFGEGSYDEMCFGLFTVYPKQNVTNTCTTWKNVSNCELPKKQDMACWNIMFNTTHPDARAISRKVMSNCNFYGSCRPECPAVVEEMRQHHCFKGQLFDIKLHILANSHKIEDIKLASALRSCDCQVAPPPVQSPNPNSGAVVLISVWTTLSITVLVHLVM
ncbi:DBH-like monooxygenase protein 2 homolog [Gigantopelta aegis]|uniref:DBH-like monooxygenase protein 2 homolog n=1 Tax=Gigantopelta aegis TaxID=1735272 RepID=UPI001B8894C9|nr:DBH-like monooxygenase protein 2 homolog [Gigantopelta aegis]